MLWKDSKGILLMKNNFADLLDKGYCVVKSFLDKENVDLIKQDFELVKNDRFLNPNFNIMPVGKKIEISKVLLTITELANNVANSTAIITDVGSTPIYFSIEHGVNFGYHQDHESWFLYGDHTNYLNIWIPVIKPSIELTNVIVLDAKRLFQDHPELLFLKGYGATRFEGGNTSYIFDDNTGEKITLNFNLDSYAECPQLAEGDALIMRGDCIHKTQDTLTSRVAISARRLLTSSIIHKTHFNAASNTKKQIIENNPAMYQKIMSQFTDSDTCTVGGLMAALK